MQEAACEDAVAAYVGEEDIKCIEISSIDAVHNRTKTLKEEFKSANDELEEDEDPHDKFNPHLPR